MKLEFPHFCLAYFSCFHLILTPLPFCYCKKQIDVSFSCVCATDSHNRMIIKNNSIMIYDRLLGAEIISTFMAAHTFNIRRFLLHRIACSPRTSLIQVFMWPGLVLCEFMAALVAVNAGTSLSTVLNVRLPSLLMELCT